MHHLRRLFDDLDATFFKRRLKGYRVRRSDSLPRNMRGYCDLERQLIRIKPGITGDSLRRLLLHEMCHAAARYGGHGKTFLRQLERLEAAGELWAREEIEGYSRSASAGYWREQVTDVLENVAMSGDPEFSKWKESRRT